MNHTLLYAITSWLDQHGGCPKWNAYMWEAAKDTFANDADLVWC